jgi:hypothetical protein
MGIVDLFKRRTVITEGQVKELGGERLRPKGIELGDVLRVFPGSRVVPPEPEWWLDTPQADRVAILEEASRWTKKNGCYVRVVEEWKGPHRCEHCGDHPHAKVVTRSWPDGTWDWTCHKCGRAVSLTTNKIS